MSRLSTKKRKIDAVEKESALEQPNKKQKLASKADGAVPDDSKNWISVGFVNIHLHYNSFVHLDEKASTYQIERSIFLEKNY